MNAGAQKMSELSIDDIDTSFNLKARPSARRLEMSRQPKEEEGGIPLQSGATSAFSRSLRRVARREHR
jgi:hypothetical protein